MEISKIKDTHRAEMLASKKQVLTGSKTTRLMSSLKRAITLNKEYDDSLQFSLTRAKEAVRLASRLCYNVQQKIDISKKISKKDHSPVTVADFGAQAIVTWSLLQHYPKTTFNMIAEEDSSFLRTNQGAEVLSMVTAQVNEVLPVSLSSQEILDLIDLGGSDGGATGSHWVLDPVDGTRGFVQLRQYAVCLGLIQDGQAVLGAMACPNLPRGPIDAAAGSPRSNTTCASPPPPSIGSLFSAHRGGGAFEESLWIAEGQGGKRREDDDLHTDAKRIRSKPRSLPSSSPSYLLPSPSPSSPSSPSSSSSSSSSSPPPTPPPHLPCPWPSRIQVLDTAAMNHVRVMESFEARHSRHAVSAAIRTAVQLDSQTLRMDSQAKYGILARGLGPACTFLRFPPKDYKEKIWDHCAGVVIVEEAGGKVTDGIGRPLDFSKGRHVPLTKGLVAAAPHVHAQLVAALEEKGVVAALAASG